MIKGDKGKAVGLQHVFIMFIALTIVNFLFSGYNKTVAVYSDEYYYLNAAQNIFTGEGPVIDGVPISFDKVLYSFVIAPAYAVSNAVVRVRLISLINCLLMSASLFPVWLICRELDMSRKNTFRSLIITCVFPELSFSMSFMSENLSFPLTLLYIYFWLAGAARPTKKNAVILGVIGFLCFFCKMVFLAVPVAMVVFEIFYPLLSYALEGRRNGKKPGSFYSGERLIYLGIFAAVFALIHFFIKLVLFSGAQSSYQLNGITSLIDPYLLGYAVYSAFYSISAIMISVLILPFVYPVLQFSRLSEQSKKLFCFNTLSLLVTAAVMIYTITLTEDHGAAEPEQHMRYMSHFLLAALILFLKSTEADFDREKKGRHGHWAAVIAAAVIPCMIFRGVSLGIPSQTTFELYKDIKENIGSLWLDTKQWFQAYYDHNRFWALDSEFPLEIPVYAFVFGLVMTALVCVFHWLFTSGREENAVRLGTVFIALIMTVNSLDSRISWRYSNHDGSDFAPEITQLNKYLSNQQSLDIMYITGNRFGKIRGAVDTMLNRQRGQLVYTFESSHLDMENLAQNDYVISRTIFENTCGMVNASDFYYDPIEGFDYILIDRSANLGNYRLTDVTPVLEMTHYTLLKNNDRSTLNFEQDDSLTYKGGRMSILDDSFILADYVVTGNAHVNINDVVINVNVPVEMGMEVFDVQVELENRQEGYQLFMARQQGSDICIDAVSGADSVDFTAYAENGSLSFEILLPNVCIYDLQTSGMGLVKDSSCPISSIVIQEASGEE